MQHVRVLTAGALAALALLALPGPAAAAPRYSMLAEINTVRAKAGLRPLRLSPTLNRSSQRHARYLMRRDRFAHASRVRSPGFRAVGEVLEKHRGYRPRVRGTLRAWLRSPAHRAILLGPRVYWLGLGRTTGRFGRSRATIWVGRVGRR